MTSSLQTAFKKFKPKNSLEDITYGPIGSVSYGHGDSCDYGHLIETMEEILKYTEGDDWGLPLIKILDRKKEWQIRDFLDMQRSGSSTHWSKGVNLKTKRFLHKYTFRPMYGNHEKKQYSPFKQEGFKLIATVRSPEKWYLGSEQSKLMSRCAGKKDRIKTFKNFLGVKSEEPFTICSVEELFNIREWRKEFKSLYQTVLNILPKLQRAINQERLKEAKTLKFKIIKNERHLEERLEKEWHNLTPVQQIETDSQLTPSYINRGSVDFRLKETQHSVTYGTIDMLGVYQKDMFPPKNFDWDKSLKEHGMKYYKPPLPEYIPIELKYKEDRSAATQLIRYIEDLEVLLGKKVKEAWLIVPKIYPTVLLPVIRHNRYDPVKIRLFEWTLDISDIDSAESRNGQESKIYLEEYTDMDVETYKNVYNKD